MTASGVKWSERMMSLARRCAPLRLRGRRKVPEHEKPCGPPLVPGRGRRRYRPTTAKEYLEIVFWTFVVYAAWVGWNYWIWGWI